MSEILDTVYVVSLKEQLQPIESELTKELINQRPAKMIFGEYNFNVKSKYNPYLYKLFLESSTKLLNKFTLKDENFKTWCSISDNQFDITCWHNHLTTSTINGVIYLKLTKEEKGINFCESLFGHRNWVQTSYNSNIRYNFAGAGFTWDPDNNAFYPPQPFPSWSLNENYKWTAPVPYPVCDDCEDNFHIWNEENQEWDKVEL